MTGDIEIYPRSSPFESFLATAIHDIWKLSMGNNARLYVDQIKRFAQVFIPTIFAEKIKFDLEARVKVTDARIAAIEESIKDKDPFVQEDARNVDEIGEIVEEAEEVFKATLDALFAQRLLIPMRVREGRDVR